MGNTTAPRQKRGNPLFMVVSTLLCLILASAPMSVPAFASWRHQTMINSPEYKQQNGFWETIPIPDEFKLNTIHAALLPTGKVLLVAGSGNNQDNFNKYSNDGQIAVLKTAVLNPENWQIKLVDTPADLFCSGHALLHSGKLLVAGGTSGYEKLDNITKPAGAMIIHNEDPDSPVKVFKKGTKFTSPAGKVYQSTEDVTVHPATKIDHGQGNVMMHHSSAKVFVEAVSDDPSAVTDKFEQFQIEGLSGSDAQNIYGQGGPMTTKKQDFRGDNKAYEFDPIQEKYVEVGDLNESRWYPSLPVLNNGNVLAVSGLDNIGVITETTEYYDPSTQKWTWGPNLAVPTYPALFRTTNPDVLFFSGSNSGYGPEDKGREPGLWNVKTNEFTPVDGLRNTKTLETSASFFLPPAKGSNDGSQSFKVMIAGGGGVGESPLVTSRTDIIDLTQQTPRYTPGPDLPRQVRYLNATVTPWDEVIGTGGTTDYRAKGGTFVYDTFSYNPATNSMTKLADAPIARGYHSGSLLLPDGRILVFGGDPLFGDKDNTIAGKFEQRIEVFTPPHFFRGEKPKIAGDETMQVKRGQTLFFPTAQAENIQTARLIPPSSATHVTNIEQRSVGAVVTKYNYEISVQLPSDENVLPNGWYMLFVTDKNGLPSQAKMVQVTP